MNEVRPRLARQAIVIGTIVLSTLLSFAGIRLIDFYTLPAITDPPLSFVSSFQLWGNYGSRYAASAFLPSLLLTHYARIRRLWHAAILAVVAFLIYLFIAIRFMPQLSSSLGAPPYFAFHATLVAILLCVYGLIRNRRLRGRSLPGAESSVNVPIGPRNPWGGTREEWRQFFCFVAVLVLIGGGGCVVFPELQRRQIPAPVWALIRESRDLEFLTLDEPWVPPKGETIHGRGIVRRVSKATPQERAALVSCLRRSLIGYTSTLEIFSQPDYAIRITGETSTYDLLVTFHREYNMGLMELHEGNKGLATIVIFKPFPEFAALFEP